MYLQCFMLGAYNVPSYFIKILTVLNLALAFSFPKTDGYIVLDLLMNEKM